MNGAPRRFFQIHLSTAIVLMLAAGVLLWANMRPQRSVDNWLVTDSSSGRVLNLINHERGWPFLCVRTRWELSADYELARVFDREWMLRPLLYNALIALAILACVWVASERLFRRRTMQGD